MQNSGYQKTNLSPYGDIAAKLLESIFNALYILCEIQESKIRITEEKIDKQIFTCFKWINKKGYYARSIGINSHITEGFPRPGEALAHRSYGSVRIVRLVRQSWHSIVEDSELSSKNEKTTRVLLPSPIKILYDILTVPEQPHSRAYALVTCRNILFECLKVHPKIAGLPNNDLLEVEKRFDPSWKIFSLEDLTKVYSEIKTYQSHRDNYPKPRTLNSTLGRTRLFLAHYLALKGIMFLRFGTYENKMPEKSKAKTHSLRKKYCTDKNLLGSENVNYEFRRSHDYKDIPELSHIINQVWGLPLPIQNADTVFNGAMKFSSSGSLIISVHGKTGTGKTSFALAAAASLAPLGTNTYYISFEEEQEDLRARLHSLIPLYLRKLSFFEEDSKKWFDASKPELFLDDNNEFLRKFTKEHLNKIKTIIDNTRTIKGINQSGIPTACPLLIVVDGVSVLCSGKYGYDALHEFIKCCKSLNVLVLLLSGENNKAVDDMDYLVDTVIKLNYEGTEKVGEKPLRIFQLIKTRQQISRPGSHIFHLSGGKGFRIDPQLPSQLDKQQNLIKHLPNYKQIINVLNEHTRYLEDTEVHGGKYLDLYSGSSILLHGHGSGGKAGLALKILATQPERKSELRDMGLVPTSISSRRRILIISFLYGEAYYKNLLKKMGKKEHQAYLEIFSFTPGFLTPENLLSKISRKLNTGVLQGEPFTGVLLDGLHNVFLQFPLLKENTMAWPMLYSMLSRSNVTIVTTFTTFSFDFTHGIKAKSEGDYDEVLIEGHKPFLHALVQATDFYLMLEQKDDTKIYKKNEGDYRLTVKEAINQKVPNASLIWDRERMIFK